MRISGEERRAIAKKLRYTANDDLGGLSLQKNLAAITKAEDSSWRGVMRRLADLIDRPKAKREDDGTSVCGHCGFRFDVSVNVTGGFSEVVLANHCPNCGRLFVWRDEVDE